MAHFCKHVALISILWLSYSLEHTVCKAFTVLFRIYILFTFPVPHSGNMELGIWQASWGNDWDNTEAAETATVGTAKAVEGTGNLKHKPPR